MGGSVPIADVPDAPLSTVGVGVPNFDRLLALGAGVRCPSLSSLAGEVAAVEGVPDGVRFSDGHGRCRLN